jgi:hypothetical protein
VSRLLVFAYFVESGLLLIVVPWSVFWERNLFVERVPILNAALTNYFVRGAISGIGLVCLWAALGEVAAMFSDRRRDQTIDQDPAPAFDTGEKRPLQ